MPGVYFYFSVSEQLSASTGESEEEMRQATQEAPMKMNKRDIEKIHQGVVV